MRDDAAMPSADLRLQRAAGIERLRDRARRTPEDGHALLLINPHTSFFFRSELQVTSDEGLNAYGAATWGQFFIYQGFNAKAGWMHTSSGVDNVDEFAETIVDRRRWRTLLPLWQRTAAASRRRRSRCPIERRRIDWPGASS